MKNFLLLSLLGLFTGTTAVAQTSNNEDNVVKINNSERVNLDFVPGQVIVKLKAEKTAKVASAKGMFRSAGISSLDKVLNKYGVEKMEKLLPNEKKPSQRLRSRAANGSFVEDKDLSELYILNIESQRADSTLKLAEELGKVSEVEFAEPNYRVYAMGAVPVTPMTATDGAIATKPYSSETTDEVICKNPEQNPLYSQLWGLTFEELPTLWNKPIINKKRPVIAILDTGVDINHPDLVDNIWTNEREAEGVKGYDNDNNGFEDDIHGWDFINNSADIHDYNMHGTHVAGIAAASDNEIGIIGANPQALIMPVTVMQSDGTGDVATIIKGINYAQQNGATVINMSLGTYANSHAMRQALEKAYQKAVIVASAGNDDLPIYIECTDKEHPRYGTTFPAGYSFVLGVMANAQGGNRAEFSNFDCDGPNFSAEKDPYGDEGFNYELTAPGADIISAIPNGNYRNLNGTSMSAPLVAGAISALQMVKNYANQEELWGDLLHSSTISSAYNISERPAELSVLTLQYNDRKELGDNQSDDNAYASGDGHIDAGETVKIYPVIKTFFGPANNTKLHLEIGDEFEDASLVDIVENDVDFGYHLDAYGKAVSKNPLVFKVSDKVANGRHLKLKLVASCDEMNTSMEYPFTITIENMVKLGGLIDKDTTLYANRTYLVTENVGVMKGAKLTIEPGTTVKFREGMGISSFGRLIANGTPEKPIIFTGNEGNTKAWAGIKSHEDTDYKKYEGIFMNEDSTLFTIEKTDATPIEIHSLYLKNERGNDAYVYYNTYTQTAPSLPSLYDGIDFGILREHPEKVTDPDFLTPTIRRYLSKLKEIYADEQYPHEYSSEYSYRGLGTDGVSFSYLMNPRDTISYCKLSGCSFDIESTKPYFKDCQISETQEGNKSSNDLLYFDGERCNVVNNYDRGNYCGIVGNNKYCNFVNNAIDNYYSDLPNWSKITSSNYINTKTISPLYEDRYYSMRNQSDVPNIMTNPNPSYLGTSREDIARKTIWEIENAPNTFGKCDLSNMLKEPVHEAHGIVWKVLVNGKDAQDEYEELAPLGVGRQKFEVYFNRPMNKNVAPNIAFGVREPYTQNPVALDGSWNAEGTIYTAYIDITGKMKSDGVNRIYVWGAEDNEFFECPYEKSRFNVNVQAAGSLATGFVGKAGMGRVDLEWNNENNNFADAMGFNVYRYGESYEKKIPAGYWTNPETGNWEQKYETIMVADTVRINKDILRVDEDKFTDYDVTPGKTYYYYYKVLSTDLKEFDVSNVVAVTPLTATQGDANGSGTVDVADVVTTVNHAAGMEPKPFIFEAADMNKDKTIDILDVIGIIQAIINPDAPAKAAVSSSAVYTVENGKLYVESPVALGGIQVQLAMNEKKNPSVLSDLDGFEHTGAWLTDNDYIFLAYNMKGKSLAAGKHAILNLGETAISNVTLSDATGRNVQAVAGSGATGIENAMGSKVLNVKGIYNLKGQKIAGSIKAWEKLPNGVYIIDGVKVVK